MCNEITSIRHPAFIRVIFHRLIHIGDKISHRQGIADKLLMCFGVGLFPGKLLKIFHPFQYLRIFHRAVFRGIIRYRVCCLYKDIEGTISAEFIADQVCILIDRPTLREVIHEIRIDLNFRNKIHASGSKNNYTGDHGSLSVNG